MTKNVLVSISGLQFEVDSDDVIEVITNGQYYYKNDKHYVLYQEISDDKETEITKNTLKISENQVEILKHGTSNVHMIFKEGKETMAYYETPFGTLLIGLATSDIKVKTNEDDMNVKIKYNLSINYTHVSECDIEIKIVSNKKV